MLQQSIGPKSVTCNRCGYALTPFDNECPRCARGKTSSANHWTPTRSIPQSSNYTPLIALLLLIIVGMGGYLIYQNNQRKPIPVSSTPLPQNQPSAWVTPPPADQQRALRSDTGAMTVRQPGSVPTINPSVQSPLPSTQTMQPSPISPGTLPTEPNVNDLTNTLLVAARPAITNLTSDFYIRQMHALTFRVIETRTNVEKTNSLTSPYVGYVFLVTRLTYDPNTYPSIQESTEMATLIFGYQNGRWAFTDEKLNR